jgi:glycosyltransferase involved in cell wall biosynthesis
MTEQPPRVSIIIPAYNSSATLAKCLEGLERQIYPSYEIVLVDSSADERARAITAGYGSARYFRSARRLLPHAARNLGVTHALGELLVFTDPDLYHRSDWLERLVAAYDQGRPVVV